MSHIQGPKFQEEKLHGLALWYFSCTIARLKLEKE